MDNNSLRWIARKLLEAIPAAISRIAKVGTPEGTRTIVSAASRAEENSAQSV
ncbi:MAG: hypothetical protein WCT02_02565 [Candidatus Paceibacterota bacterium]